MSLDLIAVRQQVEQIARDAGALVLERFHQPLNIEFKHRHDVVTDADKASEALIVAALMDAYPTHHLVGEEGGGQGAPADEAEYFWYIDPIDGTANYASGIPTFTVSIGLGDRDDNALVGVVYQPTADELFSAAKGHGATLNGQPIHVRHTPDINDAMLGIGSPFGAKAAHYSEVATGVRGVRGFGSAALHLAWVASGRLDGFFESGISRWDVWGGMCVVEEAGGVVTDYRGERSPKMLNGEAFLACTPGIHAELRRRLAPLSP